MLQTLNNDQLEKMLRKRRKRKYKGFLMRNEEKPPLQTGYWLFNLDDETSFGTHWTVALVTPKGQPNLYFDSFGMPVPEEILKWLRTKNDKVAYNTTQLQERTSQACGWWCVDWCNWMNRTRQPPLDAYYDYVHKQYPHSPLSNERLLDLRFIKTPTGIA